VNPQELLMRQARTEEDVQAVVTLWNEAKEWLATKGTDQWQYPVRIDSIRQKAAEGAVWLLDNDQGEPIATITLDEDADPKLWRSSDDPSAALYLHRLVVKRVTRPHELGSAILDWAGGRAEQAGKKWLRLDAWASNEGLRRYYLDRGFTFVRTVPDVKYGSLFQRPSCVALRRSVLIVQKNGPSCISSTTAKPVMCTINTDIHVIQGDLTKERLASIRADALVACDTETSGLDWQRDLVGTIQLYSSSSGTTIMQVGATPPRALVDILESPEVVKVFHHAPFDLRFLAKQWGVHVSQVRCTKVASKLVNPSMESAQHSLSALVRRYLGIDLPKGAVRTSDWSSSELSTEQVEYASNDVRYLIPLLDHLSCQLNECGRGNLFTTCCNFLPVQVALELKGLPCVFSY
jgi:ribonuclease D